MSLPLDLILVRHGESEGNVANRASLSGDNSFFTPAHRDRHSRTFRLTDLGIEQAKKAGEWLRANIVMPFDRFYVSDYIRAKETASYLNLPCAEWRVEFHLRERDEALMDNCPADELNHLFAREQERHKTDPFLSYPAGGGESIALLCLRAKTTLLSHLARECSDKKVVVVCHGHLMRAMQIELEHLGHDDFMRLDNSKDAKDKIRTCQILWYTRRDPDGGKVTSDHLVAVRSVCPFNTETGLTDDFGWRALKRKKFSNEELLAEVEKYLRIIS